MAEKPCVVCDYPVEVGDSRMEVWKDPTGEADGKTNIMAVCGNPRCQRLARKALEEAGRKKLT